MDSAAQDAGRLPAAVTTGRVRPEELVQDRPGLPPPDDGLREPGVCFAAYDATGLVTYAGGSGWALLGQQPDAVLGRSLLEADSTDVRDGVRACLQGRPDDRTLTLRGRLWEVHHRPARDARGRLVGGMCMANDVTSWALPAVGDELDRLTGLLSRAALESRLAMGRVSGAVVVDLESFRSVNDACGRAVGDDVLVEVARRLTSAADGWEPGRWSGDVFVLLTEDPQADPPAQTQAVLRELEAPVVAGGRQLHLGVTTASASSPPVSPTRLVLHALLAVRTAKRSSRAPVPGGTALTRPARVRVHADVDVAGELQRALAEGQLVLHYQPVVRLVDARPVALEALVRWEHPERGLLGPADFLPVAERSGLLVPLGDWVVQEACHAAADWRRRFPGAGLRVAVNLPLQQLLQPRTVSVVREALRAAGCPPGALLLEVSETTLTSDVDAVPQGLAALRELGVGVAVDDFGAGWSSASYPARLPLDLLKIDRSVVAALGPERQAGAVLSALVNLARRAGISCLAQGIETADQLAVLRELPCEFGQGHIFSRPLPQAAATGWLVRALSPAPASEPAATVDAVDAAAVERALALQDQGASLHTIAAHLNLEGLRTARGRRWHHTSVAQLLTAVYARDTR